MKILIAFAALSALSPLATAQSAKLSDFAGLWEQSGPPGPPGAQGPGGGGSGGPPSQGQRPQGPRPGAAQTNADGSVTANLGAPPPDEGHRGPPIPAADAALGLDGGDLRIRSQMTDAGRAKFATFKLIDHPMYNCISPGLPTVMGMPGLQEWSVAGDAITFRQETWPEPRVASLGASPASESDTHVRQGRSYARIDGDALVITTTHFTTAWAGLGRNAPGSDQRTVVETYRRVNADTIEGEMVITDPLYLTQPLRRPMRLTRAKEGTTFETFPCDVASSQIALPK